MVFDGMTRFKLFGALGRVSGCDDRSCELNHPTPRDGRSGNHSRVDHAAAAVHRNSVPFRHML
ncbi:hypothetical protein FHT36_002913 [Xanthobacter sp. SG618]|nr:hypothetical protein [Xanthobacter sp. SG618]